MRRARFRVPLFISRALRRVGMNGPFRCDCCQSFSSKTKWYHRPYHYYRVSSESRRVGLLDPRDQVEDRCLGDDATRHHGLHPGQDRVVTRLLELLELLVTGDEAEGSDTFVLTGDEVECAVDAPTAHRNFELLARRHATGFLGELATRRDGAWLVLLAESSHGLEVDEAVV